MPVSKLLDFRAEDGWAQLCAFLGKDTPDSPYPTVNQGSNIADLYWWAISIRLSVVLRKVSRMAGPVLVVLGAPWWIDRGKGEKEIGGMVVRRDIRVDEFFRTWTGKMSIGHSGTTFKKKSSR